MLEKSTESIVDGKKDTHMNHREHQIGMDTVVNGAKACINLSYFGHVVRAGGAEDDVMLGRMNGARRRGRPGKNWLDTLNGYWSRATISNMRRDARDRAGWRGAATAVARGRMRLNGTRPITVRLVGIDPHPVRCFMAWA